MLSLGSYPETGLKDARERQAEARRKLQQGVDPAAERRAKRAAGAETFQAVALEWLALQRRKVGM